MTSINRFQPHYKVPLFKEGTLDISRYYVYSIYRINWKRILRSLNRIPPANKPI